MATFNMISALSIPLIWTRHSARHLHDELYQLAERQWTCKWVLGCGAQKKQGWKGLG